MVVKATATYRTSFMGILGFPTMPLAATATATFANTRLRIALVLDSNIKAAGITLYTIQVNTDGDATSTLLQNCASDSGKFFRLTSASRIATTFAQIATNLSKLHIAK